MAGDGPVSDLRALISERKGRPPGTGGLGASCAMGGSGALVSLAGGALVGTGGGGGGAGGAVVLGAESFWGGGSLEGRDMRGFGAEPEVGTESTTWVSSLLELISAKNGSAPRAGVGAGAEALALEDFRAIGGAGGAGGGGARDIAGAGGAGGGGGADGAVAGGTGGALGGGAVDLGSGGGAPGTGGGADGTGGAGEGGSGDGALSSNELIEPILLFFKWPAFLGRDGGILGGGLSELEPDDGTGGAILGSGGARFGRGGACFGRDGAWFGRGGGAEGAAGAGGAENVGALVGGGGAGGADGDGADGAAGAAGLWLGLEGALGASALGFSPIVGIWGADGGTIPDRLSVLLTDLSLGIPPANMSPN